MNCPSCKKKPTGFKHAFRLFGVNLNDYMMGYFRCRHCNELLKQKKYLNIFPQYEAPMWFFVPFLFLSLFFLPELSDWIFDLLVPVSGSTAGLIYIAFLVIYSVLAMTALFHFVISYTKFEAADEETLTSEANMKIQQPGWTIFSLYVVIALAASYMLFNYIDVLMENEWVFLTGFTIYVMIIMAAGAWIINRYSVSDQQ